MNNKKNIVSKRFYVALIIGILDFVFLSFCVFGFMRLQITTELSTRAQMAFNVIKDRNNELFSELEVLAKNITAFHGLNNENKFVKRNFYSHLVENSAREKQNFDAIFLINFNGISEEIIGLYSNDSRLLGLGEIRIANFVSRLKGDRFISRFMRINGTSRYFLIQRVDKENFLIGFVNTISINDKFQGLGEILIFNEDGEIYNTNDDIFALYGQGFDFALQNKLLILKKLSKLKFVYFEKLQTDNYIMASSEIAEYASLQNILFLVAGLLFLIYLLFTCVNFAFLKNRIMVPLDMLKNTITSDNYCSVARKIDDMNAIVSLKEISQRLDEIMYYGACGGTLDYSFKDALKQSSLAVISVDNKYGTITSASNGAKDIYGDDIVGKNIFVLQQGSLYDIAMQTQMSAYMRENHIIVRHDTPSGVRDLYVKKTHVREGSEITTLYVVLDASKYRKFYTDTRKKYDYLNYAPIVTMVMQEGAVVNMSVSVRDVWGYDNAKFISGELKFWDLLEPRVAKEAINEINNRAADVTRATQNFKQYYKIRHNDNKFYNYEINVHIKKSTKTVIFYFQNINESTNEINRLNGDLAFYRTVIDTRSFSACEIDLEDEMIGFDKRYMEILRYPPEKCMQTTMKIGAFTNIIYYGDLKIFNQTINECKQGKADKIYCEVRLKSAGDGYVWVGIQGRVGVTSKDGAALRIGATLEDITQKKETELELNLNANVFLQSLEAVIITDASGRILRANRAFYEIMQFSEDDVIWQFPEYFRTEHENGIIGLIKEKLDGANTSYKDEIYGVKKNGDDFPALFSAIAMRDDFNLISNYILMFNEISEIKKKESELVKIAHHDALTGLPNRVYFMNIAQEFMDNAKANGKLTAALFIDFDGFKTINDTYGHDVGDLFLQEVSKAMSALLRKGDILARLGGDEFGAIISDVKDKKTAGVLLDRLLGISNMKFNLNGNEVSASVSVGAVFYDGSENIAFTELLNRADRAMYRAKTSGKNRYFIFDKDNFDDVELSEERLKKSIEKGEFFMLYQPIIEKEKIYGYELLLRWRCDNIGILLPSDFLLDIREPRLEILISKFSFTQMLKFNIETKLLCSINISLAVLGTDDFYDFATRAIEKYKPDLELFIFEIVDFSERSAPSFKYIHKKYAKFGIKFAINNANAQNSKYLKDMPFDIVKIDMKLCLDVGKKRDGIKSLVSLVTKLREELKFNKLGAQGIENALSLRLLTNLEFDYLQGNFIAKALERKEIQAFISRFNSAQAVQMIAHDECASFLIALDYKNLALEFIEFGETGDITEAGFDLYKSKFDEILTRIKNSSNQKFMLNTEIHKQILGILAINFENLQSFILKYKAQVDKFIINLEEA